jgi:hypothetical protein
MLGQQGQHCYSLTSVQNQCTASGNIEHTDDYPSAAHLKVLTGSL